MVAALPAEEQQRVSAESHAETLPDLAPEIVRADRAASVADADADADATVAGDGGEGGSEGEGEIADVADRKARFEQAA